MLIYNLTNNFATIRYILENFPETKNGVNLLDIKKNLWGGIIRFYQYFCSDNFLVLISFIFALFIFVIPAPKKLFTKKLFIFSNFIILFILLSLLTVSDFRSQDFILISPFYAIIFGYLFYYITQKLKKFKIYAYSFLILFICMLFLIYVKSYLDLVNEIQTILRCSNIGAQLISTIIPNLKFLKIVTSTALLKYLIGWYVNVSELSIGIEGDRISYLIGSRETSKLELIISRLNTVIESKKVIYIFSVNEACGPTEPEKIFLEFLKSHNKTISNEIKIYYDGEIIFKIYKVE